LLGCPRGVALCLLGRIILAEVRINLLSLRYEVLNTVEHQLRDLKLHSED
jgi:hypothetical protein